MKFLNRFAVSLLASVLCASTLFAMPVDAKKTTKRRQPTQAELAAAAALQLTAKRPDQMVKGIIYTAMVETYAIFALLVSVLIWLNIAV